MQLPQTFSGEENEAGGGRPRLRRDFDKNGPKLLLQQRRSTSSSSFRAGHKWKLIGAQSRMNISARQLVFGTDTPDPSAAQSIAR
ncbi:hypothetical protein XH84_14865 [Bradyrhizobium nanningense]|nr:hypothetical protein XH84_14865 [Bradyrhizobium nanningense]